MGSYTPADGGFAKYFFSMLDDKDRNHQYGEAIKSCIAEFIKKEGREPKVLDIGIGTGMLSALCIKHGAKHVTGVDTNPTMIALAKDTLSEVDPTGKKFTVKQVKVGPSQLGNKKFDMFVSEILGTLTTSESMFKYIGIYAEHLNVFGGEGEQGGQRVYAVPRSTTQYFSVMSYDRAELGAPLAAAIEHATGSPEAARKVCVPPRTLTARARARRSSSPFPSLLLVAPARTRARLAAPLFIWQQAARLGLHHALTASTLTALFRVPLRAPCPPAPLCPPAPCVLAAGPHQRGRPRAALASVRRRADRRAAAHPRREVRPALPERQGRRQARLRPRVARQVGDL